MKAIAPLLRLNPGEVLINFMTGHIRRFFDSPNQQTKESFESFFGSANYMAKVQGLKERDLEDALVQFYLDAVKQTGNFPHACSAIVLHPEIDRTHFHLIYATRNLKGVEVFKEVEKQAMQVMEKARADAQQRRRVKKTQTMELFGSEFGHKSTLYDDLRERYLSKSKRHDDRTRVAGKTPRAVRRGLVVGAIATAGLGKRPESLDCRLAEAK